MNLSLMFPMEIMFGEGTVKNIGTRCKDFGDCGMIITGGNSTKASGVLEDVCNDLLSNNIKYIIYDKVTGEPDTSIVDDARHVAKTNDVDFIIGLGGGSALDVAKVTAGLHNQELTTIEYLDKYPYEYDGIPFVGVPTTAGTASEVTLNSVLYNPIKGNKYSIANPKFQAKLCIIDPRLTYSMNPSLTASTGMDALTHAIESYTSKLANPITKALAGQAISLISKSIVKAVKNGTDITARRDMALGSMVAGLAFSQTGVGLAHCISHPLGGIFHIPHGVANAILLPCVMDYNYRDCPQQYIEIGRLMGGHKTASNQVRAILEELPISKNLTSAGYKSGNEEDIVKKTFESRSIKKNPRMPLQTDIIDILNICS